MPDASRPEAERELAGVLARARFWERLRNVSPNERQRLMLNRLLEGFEGKLTSSKWATMTKTSQDSALRDIQQLVDAGVLEKDSAGGNTSYSLAQSQDDARNPMGVYKLCSHKGRLRDRCDHSWWGSFRGARVSLSKGQPRRHAEDRCPGRPRGRAGGDSRGDVRSARRDRPRDHAHDVPRVR